MTRIFLAALAAAIFVFSPVAQGLAHDPVGFINVRRLVMESEIGKKAQAELVALHKKKQEQVAVKMNELNKMKQDLNDRWTSLTPVQQFEITQDYQRAVRHYERLMEEVREDLEAEDRVLVQRVLAEAEGVVISVARQRNFTVILKEPSVLGFLDPAVDITNDVIRELNKRR